MRNDIVNHLAHIIVNDEMLDTYSHEIIKREYPELMSGEETPAQESMYYMVLCSIHTSIVLDVIKTFHPYKEAGQ